MCEYTKGNKNTPKEIDTMRKILTTINLDQPDLDALAVITERTGANRSVLIRRAITQFIELQAAQIVGSLQPLANTNRKSL